MKAPVAHANMSKARPEGRALLAFSLLEVILVLVIMVIVAAVAVPRYAEAEARYRLEGAARRIQTDVALMRDACRADGQTRTATFDAVGATYYITSAGPGLLAGKAKYTVEFSEPPYKASIELPARAAAMTFDVDGRGEIVGSGTITLAVGNDTIVVTIGSTVTVGSISVGTSPTRNLDIPVDLTPKVAEPEVK